MASFQSARLHFVITKQPSPKGQKLHEFDVSRNIWHQSHKSLQVGKTHLYFLLATIFNANEQICISVLPREDRNTATSGAGNACTGVRYNHGSEIDIAFILLRWINTVSAHTASAALRCPDIISFSSSRQCSSPHSNQMNVNNPLYQGRVVYTGSGIARAA
jgi:hypothetical protein